jgi:hypothetical protein
MISWCFDGKIGRSFTWLYRFTHGFGIPKKKVETVPAHPWESSVAHPVECRQETKSNGSIMGVVQQSLHQFFL